MSVRKLSCTLFLAVLLPLSARGQADIEAWGAACAAVLVPNELRLAHGTNTASAFREAVCRNSSSTSEGGGNLNVIEVFSIGGSSRTVTREQFCSDTSLVASTQTMYSLWSSSVPDSARTQFYQCMARFPQNSGTPSALRVSQGTQAGGGVTVTASWDRNIVGPQPRFAGLSLFNVTCPSSPWALGALIRADPTSFVCQWVPNATEGAVIIQTQNRGSGQVSLTRSITPLGRAQLIVTTQEDRVDRNDQRCGPTAQTADLHNNRFFCMFNPPPFPLACEGGWSMAHIDLPLTIPAGLSSADLAVVQSSLQIDCVNDNQGSCAWNAVGDRNRFRVIRNDAQSIVVRRTFGSRPIGVRLCGSFPHHTNVTVNTDAGSFVLQNQPGGHIFPVRLPNGATGTLNLQWADGQPEAIPVGTQSSRLVLVPSTPQSPNPFNEPNARVFLYQVRWSQ